MSSPTRSRASGFASAAFDQTLSLQFMQLQVQRAPGRHAVEVDGVGQGPGFYLNLAKWHRVGKTPVGYRVFYRIAEQEDAR